MIAATVARRRAWAMLVALLAMLSALLLGLGAAPAQAHGGPIEGQIAQDGEGGIYVSFVYAKDSHPVEALITATVEGRSATGELLEPVPLVSASQGSGIWGVPAGTFPEGSWDVTVRVTDPIAYETSAPLEIVMVDVVAEDYVAPAAAVADGAPVEEFGSWFGVGLGVAAVAVVVVVGALLVFRRSRVSA
ncbi:hypothetical protein [Agromyces sp. Leaf222]|uniref:hypothetical protein n=1 Tax=Agromyces sp. Leaf222 TaxID=1735688 RepID=UPI0012F93A1B|nr:hypothetical protein [Agromyces sp. Leaf222]